MLRSIPPLHLFLFGFIFLLSGCSGKPTLAHCKNPETQTTVCSIPTPPEVEVKPLFPAETIDRKINLEALTAKTRQPSTRCKSCNKPGYSIQIGLFQQTLSQTQLSRIKSSSKTETLYRYPFPPDMTGITAGYFSSKKLARVHLTEIKDDLPADAYITQLPVNAELISFPDTE